MWPLMQIIKDYDENLFPRRRLIVIKLHGNSHSNQLTFRYTCTRGPAETGKSKWPVKMRNEKTLMALILIPRYDVNT